MNTAFIGLDYIIDIMHPDGKIARSAQHAIKQNCIEHANQALQCAREKGWLTILVKVGFSQGYQIQPKHSPMFGQADRLGALLLDHNGTNFHPDLQVKPSDLIIVKPRVSAFYCTSLEAALRANNIQRLVIAGVSTAWAVQSTARDGHDRDYQIVIVEDACAALNQQQHDASIELLSTIATVATAAELLLF